MKYDGIKLPLEDLFYKISNSYYSFENSIASFMLLALKNIACKKNSIYFNKLLYKVIDMKVWNEKIRI